MSIIARWQSAKMRPCNESRGLCFSRPRLHSRWPSLSFSPASWAVAPGGRSQAMPVQIHAARKPPSLRREEEASIHVFKIGGCKGMNVFDGAQQLILYRLPRLTLKVGRKAGCRCSAIGELRGQVGKRSISRLVGRFRTRALPGASRTSTHL